MVADEIRAQVMQSLLAFDFSSAFPLAYAGVKAVTIMHGWPSDLIDNILAESDGQMPRPVISVNEVDVADVHRSLGNISTVGQPVGMVRRATRIEATYLVGCWADRRLGGADLAEAIGGLVIGWAFVSSESLAAYRHLRASASRPAIHVREQLWCYDVTLQGVALLSYDSTA